MGKNYFTKEQVSELEQNPYVQKVSEKAITYTVEFKKEFAIQYAEGNSPSLILTMLGFNTKTLGRKRINNIVARAKEHRLSGDYNDQRAINPGRPSTKILSDKEKIARLEHQVQYLKQENEFLKKIKFLDNQAEWTARRKQKQKKSSK